MCRDRIKSFDNILANDKNNAEYRYERGEAKFFLAMVTAWETGDDAPFHDDITEDLKAAIDNAPTAHIKAKYEKAYTVVEKNCGLCD
jgi:hypothetical protein